MCDIILLELKTLSPFNKTTKDYQQEVNQNVRIEIVYTRRAICDLNMKHNMFHVQFNVVIQC